MGKKEKIIIGILIVIIIILIIIIIARKGENEEKNNTTEEVEEYVEVLGDGTKFNTSDKLHETKKFDGMEISDFQLTEKDNYTLLLGTIKNTSNTTKGDYAVEITILDKQGKEIITTPGYIIELEPGESTQLSSSATFDYANAYDFKINKK